MWHLEQKSKELTPIQKLWWRATKLDEPLAFVSPLLMSEESRLLFELELLPEYAAYEDDDDDDDLSQQ